ncbi:hypothetical protein RIF29_19868 [Crotalaria pallida]|uniref:Uncharacterized protein n=1 Tax=Crotalaria pallida TaxID=3830 RepID=A0AAN9I4I4_CROPI
MQARAVVFGDAMSSSTLPSHVSTSGVVADTIHADSPLSKHIADREIEIPGVANTITELNAHLQLFKDQQIIRVQEVEFGKK